MSIPRTVINQAAQQGGYITRSQLGELGLSSKSVDWKVRSGELSVVAPGVYQVFPSDDLLDVVRGAVLALPEAVVSHESAAYLLKFPRLPAFRPTVTVASHTTHRFPGVMVRRCDDLDADHTTSVDSLLTTNVPRTVFDLAGVLRFDEFEAIAEELILAGRLRHDRLEQLTIQLGRRGKRGTRRVRDFLEMRAGAPGSTVLERRGRAILAAAQLPPPTPQYPIPWDPTRRFDDAYPDARFAIEWDSRAWHLQRAAMESDRERDRIAAMHGWQVVRFTWNDVTRRRDEVIAIVSTLLHNRRRAS